MLRLSLLTISSILLVSCAGLPPKPKGDLCVIDIPRDRLVCAPISGADKPKDLYDPQKFLRKSETVDLPLHDADKYVSFSPDTWENVSVYMKQLEDMIQHKNDK